MTPQELGFRKKIKLLKYLKKNHDNKVLNLTSEIQSVKLPLHSIAYNSRTVSATTSWGEINAELVKESVDRIKMEIPPKQTHRLLRHHCRQARPRLRLS